MEPAPVTIETYVIHTRVLKISEKKTQEYVSGYGKDAVFHTASLGWFLLAEGFGEAICLGPNKPNLSEGDKIKITIRRTS
jgi:hypothetical protein